MPFHHCNRRWCRVRCAENVKVRRLKKERKKIHVNTDSYRMLSSFFALILPPPHRWKILVSCFAASQYSNNEQTSSHGAGSQRQTMNKRQLSRRSHKTRVSGWELSATRDPAQHWDLQTWRYPFWDREEKIALPARREHTVVLGWHEGFLHWDLLELLSSLTKWCSPSCSILKHCKGNVCKRNASWAGLQDKDYRDAQPHPLTFNIKNIPEASKFFKRFWK